MADNNNQADAGSLMNPSGETVEIEPRHTGEIEDIITKVPPWIINWGIIIFGGILLAAFAVSALIRYPETIKTPIRFQATDNSSLKMTGVLEISQHNFYKIKIGQKVIIQLEAYSPDEYGQLEGQIASIADEPAKNGLFTVNATLSETQLKHAIKIKPWMNATAEIITHDETIFDRIIGNINK